MKHLRPANPTSAMLLASITLLLMACEPGKREQNLENPGYMRNTGSLFSTVNGFSLSTINDSVVPVAIMDMPRAAHSATPLKDGRILICGGFAGGTTLSSSEIYNPVSKTFKLAGSMSIPSAGHSATLLPGGKVLISGGYNGNYLSRAEFFDPVTETFKPGGKMNAPRSGHTATQLNDGTILLAGGVGIGWSFLESAELYDPRKGTFFATGAMSVARESHTATKLKNGTVLITGGHKGRRADIQIYSISEVYNPASGKFKPTGSMTKIHHKHDAVMLGDGRVLITGGSDERDGRGAYASSEIYDPAKATFVSAGNMNLTRYKHNGTSVLLDNGLVFIAGGAQRAEIYNPTTKAFTIVAGSMKTQRLFSCATLIANGKVLVTGGYDENQEPSAKAWLYSYEAPGNN